MADDAVQRNLQFGPFELSSRERVLLRSGVVLPLGSRALDILIYLAERPGQVIAKQDWYRGSQEFFAIRLLDATYPERKS